MIGLLALAAAAQTQAAPEPVGKWVVDYGEHMCILQHNYAAAERRYTLGIRPWPLSTSVEVVALMPPDVRTPDKGDAEVTLNPSGTKVEGRFESGVDTDKHQRIVVARVQMSDYTLWREAESVTLAFGKAAPLTLAVPKAKIAVAALEKCQQQAIAVLGIDAAETGRIAEKAVPLSGPGNWLVDHYPPEAVRRRAQGRVVSFLGIGTDGRVGDCKVIDSSRSADLDAATCEGFIKLSTWRPARDAQGTPIPSHLVMVVDWQLNGR